MITIDGSITINGSITIDVFILYLLFMITIPIPLFYMSIVFAKSTMTLSMLLILFMITVFGSMLFMSIMLSKNLVIVSMLFMTTIITIITIFNIIFDHYNNCYLRKLDENLHTRNNIRQMDSRIVQLQKIIDTHQDIIDDQQRTYENLYNSPGNPGYGDTEIIDSSQPNSSQPNSSQPNSSQPNSSQILSIFRFIPIIKTIQEIYIELYERNYKQIIADKRKIIADNKRIINEQEMIIIDQDNAYTELYYRPGNPGYLKAFTHFNTLVNSTEYNCCFKQKNE